MSEQQIPVSKVDVGPAEEELVLRVLRSGQLAEGAMVAELEGRFAEIAGVRHAVAVSNGTVALEVSLEALRHLEVVRAGDEVIATSFTFVATANAIVHAGRTAVFADIEPGLLSRPGCRSPRRLTDRTRVLLPVHLYGLPADMTALEQSPTSGGCSSSRTRRRPTARRWASGPSAATASRCSRSMRRRT